jgi:hypothetical protein
MSFCIEHKIDRNVIETDVVVTVGVEEKEIGWKAHIPHDGRLCEASSISTMPFPLVQLALGLWRLELGDLGRRRRLAVEGQDIALGRDRDGVA